MAEPGSELMCLLLSGEDALAADLRAALSASGMEATLVAPGSREEAVQVLRQSRPGFVVVRAPLGAGPSAALAPEFDVASVSYPSLAVATGAIDDAELERLRRRGILAVLEHDAPPEEAELTLFQLSRSRFWFRGRLDEIPLEEVVTTLASDHQTALIEVACDHLEEVAAASGRAASGSCLEPREGMVCPGAVGRLYLDAGALLLAETDTLRGVEALRALLSLSKGRFVVAESFLRPNQRAREALAPALREALSAPPSPAAADRLRQTTVRDETSAAPESKPPATPRSPGDSMKKLAAALAALPASYGGTRCNLRGEVLSKTGNFDAETTAAAAAIARESLADVAGGLGLGALQSWAFCHQAGSVFVLDGLELTITVGQVTKNPESVLRRMSANLAEMKP